MSEANTPFARIVGALKNISNNLDLTAVASDDTRGRSVPVPGGPFATVPGPTKLTLGKTKEARHAVLQHTEQVTLFGTHSSGAGAVQNSLIAQQIARDGAYILLDVATDRDRQDMLAYLHRQAKTLNNFRVLNADDPGRSHTYNPLISGTSKEVAARVMSAFSSLSYVHDKMTDLELAKAKELLAVLIQALRDREGVAQFAGLHETLSDMKGFLALVASPSILPSTRAELSLHFAEYRAVGGGSYDLEKIQKALACLMRYLPSFATGKIGRVLNVAKPEIDLLDALNTRQGVFVMLPTLGKDLAAIGLGRLVLADLCDALEAKKGYALNPFQPPGLVMTIDTPCLAQGGLTKAFAAAKESYVNVVACVSTSRDLAVVPESDREALLKNTATKVFLRAHSRETSEELRSFGDTLRGAGGSNALPDLMATLKYAPFEEGFISRGLVNVHFAAWPTVEVPSYLDEYQVPQRQAEKSST